MAMDTGTTGSNVRIAVFGGITATANERHVEIGGPRQQALVAILAANVGRTVLTDTLIDAVWDGEPPNGAHRTFRTYVAKLRRALDAAGADGAAVVRTEAAGYRLDASVTVDTDEFAALVSSTQARVAAGEAGAAAAELGKALTAWGGRPYGPWADAVWAQADVARFAELHTTARELHARALLDSNRAAAATAVLQSLVADDPLRESAVRLLMEALYRTDRQAEALRTGREHRERLAEETGLDPSDELGMLESLILTRDPRLDVFREERRLRGYVLGEAIATTPVGIVHRAHQPSIDRDVALTVMPPTLADDPEFVRQFESRAQLIAGVEHPNIVPIYDYWREPGSAHLVTRLPGGGSLSDRLSTGLLSKHEVSAVLSRIGPALRAAHEHGITHDALGPDAVVFDRHGDAFLWGFSLTTDAPVGQDLVGLAHLVADMTGVPLAAVGGAEATEEGGHPSALPPAVVSALHHALEPSDVTITTTEQLVAAVISACSDDPAPDLAGLPHLRGPNPYRGLAAFRETDADVFFGRSALVELLHRRVRHQSFLALVGPSGSGKSSVVRAGLLPRLREAGAYVTTMVPGARPLDELEIALTRIATSALPDVSRTLTDDPGGLPRLIDDHVPPGGRVVLVIDQFEELFTIADAQHRAVLLQAISHALVDPYGRVTVVATLRSDFLSEALNDADAGPLVRGHAEMITPLTTDELHEAVVGPAELAGVAVEPVLITAIATDAAGSPGSLPMVQYALTEMYAASDDGELTVDAYHRIGGIHAVLGQRAEEIHDALDDEQRASVRALFQRLVTVSDQGAPVRRRAAQTELRAIPRDVIARFGGARLLTFDHDDATREPTVEVAHEALLREWSRLRRWIEEDRDDLRTLAHLTTTASDWHATDRTNADLYRGARLDTALAFAEEHRRDLTPIEADFLAASMSRRADDRSREERRLRRLRALVGGLAALLVVSLVAGGVAVSARNDVAQRARDAEVSALSNAARATATDDLGRAALLAVEAVERKQDSASLGALLNVLAVDPRIVSAVEPEPAACGNGPGTGDVAAITQINPDGYRIQIVDKNQNVLHDIESPEIECASVDASGRYAIGSAEDAIYVFDVASGSMIGELPISANWFGIRFLPTAPEIVLVDNGAVLRVSLPDLEIVRMFDLGLPPWEELPVNPRLALDGMTYVITEGEFNEELRTITMLDVDTGETSQFEYLGAVVDVALRSATELVVVGQDAVEVIDMRSGETLHTVPLQGRPRLFREPPLENDILVVTTEAGIELIDVARGRPAAPAIVVDSAAVGMFFTGDGTLRGFGPAVWYEIDLNGATRLGMTMDVDTEPWNVARLAADRSGIVAFPEVGPKETFIDLETGTTVDIPTNELGLIDAGLLEDGGLMIYDREKHQALLRRRGATVFELDLAHGFSEPAPAQFHMMFRDDRMVHSFGETGQVLVVNHRTGDLVTLFDIGQGVQQARPVANDEILVADRSLQVSWYDADGVKTKRAPIQLGFKAFSMVESSDRSLVAVGLESGVVQLWNEDAELTAELLGINDLPFELAFIHDDTRLITQYRDGTTLLWDVATGQQIGPLVVLPRYAGRFVVDPDGERIHQPTHDGRIVTIDLDPATWLASACELAPRMLQQSELDPIVPDSTPQSTCAPTT